MRYAFAPILLVLFSCGPSDGPPSDAATTDTIATADPLAKYRQLVGEWIDSTSSREFTCFERWTAEGDSALDGFGHVLADNDTVFVEELRMAVRNGTVNYMAKIASQNDGAWVPFAEEPTGTDTLRFENVQHDFPQCITYALNKAGGWDVAVTGSEKGKVRSEEFRFQRR